MISVQGSIPQAVFDWLYSTQIQIQISLLAIGFLFLVQIIIFGYIHYRAFQAGVQYANTHVYRNQHMK